jgi:hypothetical protein
MDIAHAHRIVHGAGAGCQAGPDALVQLKADLKPRLRLSKLTAAARPAHAALRFLKEVLRLESLAALLLSPLLPQQSVCVTSRTMSQGPDDQFSRACPGRCALCRPSQGTALLPSTPVAKDQPWPTPITQRHLAPAGWRHRSSLCALPETLFVAVALMPGKC